MTKKYELTSDEAARLDKDFKYHATLEGQAVKYEMIRAFGKDYARCLLAKCPRSRELSLALTKLEEVVFWANASIARNEGESLVET